jgi:hypothetical protein
MTRILRLVATPLAVLGVASVLPAPAAAQQLTLGTWTGTLELQGGAQISVEFTVTAADESYEITMNAVNGVPSPATDFEVDGRKMAFVWAGFSCSLQERNNQYAGDCEAADGSSSKLTLAVPMVIETDPGKLTTEDLMRTRAATVFDAVQQLRQRWLRDRAFPRVNVYDDREFMGGIEYLRSIEPIYVDEIRFYGPADADRLFGGENPGGAIGIIPKVRRR